MTGVDSIIKVRKNTGELVPFDVEKLKNALRRSGATEKEIPRVIEKVRSSLYDGITTKKIYQIAYGILSRISHNVAGRYRLKKALFQFGPSGYPFEHFVAKLLEFEGYEVKTGQLIQGRCIKHEVDVVAKKPGKILMAECKFHQSENVKNDVKISLYIQARFNDIREELMKDISNLDLEFEPLLITNTRFTEDALQYAKCKKMKLISWDYPGGSALKDWIDLSGFHPVTSLKSLTKAEKKGILEKGIVLCREVVGNPDILTQLAIPQQRRNKILKEAKALI